MCRTWLVITILFLNIPQLYAQCDFGVLDLAVLNGAAPSGTILTKKVVAYTYLVERDVLWSKRIWREIDLREKLNHPMYYPLEPTDGRASLWDIIRCNVEDGALTAYHPGPLLEDGEFKHPMTLPEVDALLVSYDTVWTPRLSDGELEAVPITEHLESYSIKKYRLKEDWFFDKQRSVLEVRIVGLAPMKEVIGEDGEVRGYAPVFWLYFPECRYVFVNAVVFNRQNTAEQMSYDDLFWKRMFSSYIIKEANVFDRRINEEYTGINALLESEKVKDDIFRFEHDLWHF